jgi:hypothetical protein
LTSQSQGKKTRGEMVMTKRKKRKEAKKTRSE